MIFERIPPKAVLAAAAVMFAASAVFAVYSWNRRGVCADMTVSAAVAAVCLICAAVLSKGMADASNAERHLTDPVFLVKISGPSEKKQKIRPKGRIPDH